MQPIEAYRKLENRFDRASRVREATQVLGWDRATKMPDGGLDARRGQMSALERHFRELVTAPEVEEWLGDADAASEELDPWERANLREMRRLYDRFAAVPLDLVETWLEKGVECRGVWRQARPDDDFGRLKPHLAEVIDLTREIAQAKSDALGVPPYDALLDRFAPGFRSERVDELFDDVAEFLPSLIDEALQSQTRAPEPIWPDTPMSAEGQYRAAETLMDALGFDFEHGRLDTSPHGFCGGHPGDVRITTRWDTEDFREGIYCVLHETGHAMYTRQLPSDWFRQPVGLARGMVVHESQSLLVERCACRTRAFCEFAAPRFADSLGDADAFTPDNLHRLVTRVERQLIRVEADEVTYPAHVMLRYELEQDLLSGDLPLEDLPGAWNEAMEKHLGIIPPDNRDGCMQDIHWMDGTFGYFPTYLLGAMAAAQQFEAAEDQLDGLHESIAGGDFGPLMDWLETHVHGRGSETTADAMLEDATGQPLTAEPLERHLRRRYVDR